MKSRKGSGESGILPEMMSQARFHEQVPPWSLCVEDG